MACKRDDRLAGEDLTGCGVAAQASGEVQRSAPKTALDGECFPRVEADTDAEGKGRLALETRPKQPLQFDGCAQCSPRRGEDCKGLVAAKLYELASVRSDSAAGEIGEPGCDLRTRLVAVLIRVTRIAANVGNQVRAKRRRRLSVHTARPWD